MAQINIGTNPIRPRNGPDVRSILVKIFLYATLFAAVAVILVPIYIIFVNAFKTTAEYASGNVFQLPGNFFDGTNFSHVMYRGKFPRAFANTGIILFFSIAGNIALGTMTAYALGRFQFRLKKYIIAMYAAAAVIPLITTQVAVFNIVKSLGIYNTHMAPIFLYLGTDIVQIYLFLQFIRTLPYELDEAAMVEGASLFRIFTTIIFPLLLPAVSTIVILKTITIYNDMYVPYLYMPSPDLNVVSTVLMKFMATNRAQFTYLSMAILIIMTPSIILYLFLQRYIFAGIVSGSVKS